MPRRYGSTPAVDHHEDSPLLETAYCDHYPHNDSDDGSSGGGGGIGRLGRRAKKKNGNSNNCGAAIGSCFRTFANILLLPLLLLTALSLLYSYKLQNQLTTLSTELSTATQNIATLTTDYTQHSHAMHSMNETLTNHSAVIARFENSVSNSDVLQKLEELEQESEEREERVEAEMEKTKKDIGGVLRETKNDIDKTVTDATAQINSQVLYVQSTLSSYIRTTQDQFSTENSFMIYQLAGTFTLLGCLISMWHMTAHLRNFHQPFVQRKILAILWMCPIYSITSWLSLVIPTLEGYLAIVKDLYEAYVIYQFLSFCIAVLSGKDGDRNAVVDLLAKHADHLSPPAGCKLFGCCRKRLGGNIECEDEKRQLADDVLLQCQLCAMQFVFLRPLLTALLFLLKKIDYHGPMFGPGSPFDHSGSVGIDEFSSGGGGMMDYRSPQCYIIILENVSVFVAFSGLLNFYHAVQEDLSWCRPFPKFLCIKGVVFMTFWQGIAIALLASTTDLFSSGGETVSTGDGDDEDQVETWAKQAQNFLICLEMLGFSIAHFYCFPVEEWEEGYRPVEDKGKFGDNMALGDFLHDLKLILRHKERKKSIAKEKAGLKPNSDDSISTVLEEDEELGRTDSTEDGLQTLLHDVEDLLESDSPSGSSRVVATGQSEGKSSGKSPTMTPRTYRKSVEESLQAMDAPPELRQATALLLQSSLLDENTARLLASDIMEKPIEGGPNEEIDDQGEKDEDMAACEEESKQSCSEEAKTSAETNAAESMAGRNAAESSLNERVYKPASAIEENESQQEPPDSNSGLSPSFKTAEMLRPSIFTMHSTSPPDEK